MLPDEFLPESSFLRHHCCLMPEKVLDLFVDLCCKSDKQHLRGFSPSPHSDGRFGIAKSNYNAKTMYNY